MTFPCLICGQLPIIDHSYNVPGSSPCSSSPGGNRTNIPPMPTMTIGGTGVTVTPKPSQNQNQNQAKSVGGGGGTTIRTLSKDISDKIFQNLCKHLYIKSEPSWFIQNPGEQMPLCAICSAAVLEVYTLQTKVDQFNAMIKKHVSKLERIVADTEIATNWMATKEEQDFEEAMWNSLPCTQTTIRIARERHDRFRNQILQNFKNKVKLRMKLRATGQQDYDSLDVEPAIFQPPPSVSVESVAFENGERSEGISSSLSSSQYNPPFKKLKTDNKGKMNNRNVQQKVGQPRPSPTPSPSSSNNAVGFSANHNTTIGPSGGVGGGMNFFKYLNVQRENGDNQNHNRQNQPMSSPGVGGRSKGTEEFHDESEISDDHEQAYPDVQIVCTAGSVDYDIYKEETDFSGDGEESMELEGSLWYPGEDEEEAMVIPDGEEVVWLAHNVVLRKSFLDQLLIENLKPSVFLRKLMFAVFGLKQIASSSGTTGSNKPGAKPSLDRNKFEVLRDYTIDTYGIRENLQELDDLNRKIRTICCDARKALKRKAIKSQTLLKTEPNFDAFNASSASQIQRTQTPLGASNNSEDYAEVTGIPTGEEIQISVSTPANDGDTVQEHN